MLFGWVAEELDTTPSRAGSRNLDRSQMACSRPLHSKVVLTIDGSEDGELAEEADLKFRMGRRWDKGVPPPLNN